jgi:hypothetical protein
MFPHFHYFFIVVITARGPGSRNCPSKHTVFIFIFFSSPFLFNILRFRIYLFFIVVIIACGPRSRNCPCKHTFSFIYYYYFFLSCYVSAFIYFYFYIFLLQPVVPEAETALLNIKELICVVEEVIYSLVWRPETHPSFADVYPSIEYFDFRDYSPL